VGAALVQVAMLLASIAAVMVLSPMVASGCIVFCLLVFSMARGVGSVAFQDVTGKTIPKGKRGRMLATRGMIGGLLTIGVGLALKILMRPSQNIQPALMLLFLGALLWLIAALAFAAIRESSGSIDGGRNAWREALAGWHLLRREAWFRRFLLVRVALLSVELASPFYVLYFKGMFPGRSGTLGVIVIASGLAAALSSPFWGRFADLSSRLVLSLSGLLGAIGGLSALAMGMLPRSASEPYLMASVFVMLGFSEAGVLLGRKTYLIDRVDSHQRATYVAFANSVIGMAALLFGSLGVIAQFFGFPWLIGVLCFMGAVGGVLSYTLPEISISPYPAGMW
jgi:hypothetical protein